MFLWHYVTAHPTALYSVVTRLNGSCRTRRFLQNSTVFAGLDGSCRTRQGLPFHHPFGAISKSDHPKTLPCLFISVIWYLCTSVSIFYIPFPSVPFPFMWWHGVSIVSFIDLIKILSCIVTGPRFNDRTSYSILFPRIEHNMSDP